MKSMRKLKTKMSEEGDRRQKKLTDFFAPKVLQAVAKEEAENELVLEKRPETRPTSSPLRQKNFDLDEVIPVTPEPCRKKGNLKKRLPLEDDDDDDVITSAVEDQKTPTNPLKVKRLALCVEEKEPAVQTELHLVRDDRHFNKESNWTEQMHDRFGRHEVLSVSRSSGPPRVVLGLRSTSADVRRTCVLEGFWVDTAVEVGDTVHVLSPFKDQVAVVDNAQGLLVVDPDVLVSGTTVVSTCFCMRKTVLGERFKGIDASNLAMVVGKFVHALFQEVVTKRIFSRRQMLDVVRELKDIAHLNDVYSLKDEVSSEKIDAEIAPYLNALESWMRQYVANVGPVQSIKGQRGQMRVSEVLDIEENVWSPRLGLKGKIDVSVEVEIHNVGRRDPERKVMPLELKTGRDSFSSEHVGQTMLYTMMMADRRANNPPTEGLLLYLKNGSMKEVPDGFTEKRGLMQLRNELVFHSKRPLVGTDTQLGPLPDPISNRFCGRCPHLTTCSLYARHIEKRNLPANHPLSELGDATLSRLSAEHVEYFLRWCRNVFLEERDAKAKSGPHLWCCGSRQREDSGDCFSSMVLTDVARQEGNWHTFARKETLSGSKPLGDIGLAVGDYVTVSEDEGDGIAIAIGPIRSVTDDTVVVSLERNLGKRAKAVYRLDRHELRFTSSAGLSNLARLLDDCANSERVRATVVDRRPPSFDHLTEDYPREWDEYLGPLNQVQRLAVLRAVSCKDYLLIKGFPGAGKTATIVCLIQLLQKLGRSVLLTSHTNAAVDNVLVKLLRRGVNGVLRIGHVARVDPQVLPYTPLHQTKGFETVEQLRAFYDSRSVVAATCYGVDHPIFSKRTFDVCVVDEATQVPQPVCLGPLLCARRFVLVGDPEQLAPIVNSAQARAAGAEETVFSRLDREGASVRLNVQFRMNGEIARLANALTYGGALECADEDLARSVVHLPELSLVMRQVEGGGGKGGWLEAALSDKLSESAVFLDTDGIPAFETRNGQKQVVNEVEAHIVAALTQLFVQCGCAPSRIGVITPYRNQVGHLKLLLGPGDVEVSTVDQFQGRDKEVVLLSCVRTGTQHSSAEIMHERRRLNVSLTRAKRKLVVVGSREALVCYEPFRLLLGALRPDQEFLLPPGAHSWCQLQAQRFKRLS